MKLQEFLDQDLCDVPVKLSLKDGTNIVFRCDGSNSVELTGSVVGADVFIPFEEILECEVLTEDTYKKYAQDHEVHWYR